MTTKKRGQRGKGKVSRSSLKPKRSTVADVPLSATPIKSGVKVQISDPEGPICKAIVISFSSGTKTKITIKSLETKQIDEFAFIPGIGWKLIFDDPMQQGVRCISQRAPACRIEEI